MAAAPLPAARASKDELMPLLLFHHGAATCRPRREARTQCGDIELGWKQYLHFAACQSVTTGALAAAESDVCLLTQAAIEAPIPQTPTFGGSTRRCVSAAQMSSVL